MRPRQGNQPLGHLAQEAAAVRPQEPGFAMLGLAALERVAQRRVIGGSHQTLGGAPDQFGKRPVEQRQRRVVGVDDDVSVMDQHTFPRG